MLKVALQAVTLSALASQLACAVWVLGGMGDGDYATYLPVVMISLIQALMIAACIAWYVATLKAIPFSVGWPELLLLSVGMWFLAMFLWTLVMPIQVMSIHLQEFWTNPTSSMFLSYALSCLLVSNMASIHRGLAQERLTTKRDSSRKTPAS